MATSSRWQEEVEVALARGDIAGARRMCEHELERHPDDAAACSGLARIECSMAEQRSATGDDQGAVSHLRRAVSAAPQWAEAWHRLGTGLRAIGAEEEAFAAFKTALGIDPHRWASYLALGELLAATGQADDALGCFERAVRHNRDGDAHPEARLARALAERGEVRRAAEHFDRALARDPRHLDARLGRAAACEALGERAGALCAYRHVLAERPGHALALGQFLKLARPDEAGDLVARARDALAADATPDPARALVGYGLARYQARHGDIAAAVEAGRTANAARRRSAGGLDQSALQRRVDHLIRTYDADFFAGRSGWGQPDEGPVFIVGLPRSGTTLVEQILAAHPEAEGAGELEDLPRLALGIAGGGDADTWRAAACLDERASRRIAEQYSAALRRGGRERARRVTDKTPFNLFHLAFAATLFPGARVIHCVRDPRDTALSIWLEDFSPSQRYATDFVDIACLERECRRLMVHWQRVLPLSLLTVTYEDLVSDPATQTTRLLDFVGLPHDEGCLAFHASDRPVQTPSRWQVRQPIDASAVGRWRRFSPCLPELERAFSEP